MKPKYLPILFNGEMVRAILDGRKTQTRRLIKPQPKGRLVYSFAGSSGIPGTWGYPGEDAWKSWGEEFKQPAEITPEDRAKRWTPPCHTDDVLYVRETWQYVYNFDDFDQPIMSTGRYIYRADDPMPFSHWVDADGEYKDYMPWKPSIHMPKEAARIFLRVTNVRVERLQAITQDDAISEGILCYEGWQTAAYKLAVIEAKKTGTAPPLGFSPKERFRHIWETTIQKADIPVYGWEADPFVFVISFERITKQEAEQCMKGFSQ